MLDLLGLCSGKRHRSSVIGVSLTTLLIATLPMPIHGSLRTRLALQVHSPADTHTGLPDVSVSQLPRMDRSQRRGRRFNGIRRGISK
jgi:hypothetical protein